MPNTSSHSLLIVALLGACTTNMTTGEAEPPPNGDGSGHPDMSTLAGVVEIDNAIQNAMVYLDNNGNNLLDAGEPSTTTDATGHYTFSWPSDKGQFAHAVGAIVNADAIRAGTSATVGFAVHLRAPLTVTPDAYHDYFVNTSDLAAAIEAELVAGAEDFAAELFAEFQREFVEQLEEGLVRLVAGELFAELLG